jgi:hypothetical protein
MAKKRKNHATTASRDSHDHRADELVFDLVIAARDITFDVVSRHDGTITLHAHLGAQNNADPIVIVVTATDYIINGTHFGTVAQTLDTLASVTSVATD